MIAFKYRVGIPGDNMMDFLFGIGSQFLCKNAGFCGFSGVLEL